MRIVTLNRAVVALSKLQLSGAITSFQTNFNSLDETGTAPEVTVTVRGQDELSIERARRAVKQALEPHIRGVGVIVRPGLLLGQDGGRFHFERHEEGS